MDQALDLCLSINVAAQAPVREYTIAGLDRWTGRWTGLVDWRFAGNIYIAIVNLCSESIICCCTVLLSMTRGILWGRPDDDDE